MASYSPNDISKIKIVIWDLDETFWNGTVDNGDVITIPEENIQLVKDLTDKGIVNSICSKNNREKIYPILRQYALEDYFVYPSIDWTSKGPRIKNLLSTLGLRPDNALFIDDNELNRKEVEYWVPSIMQGGPECISMLIATIRTSNLKQDSEHKRLKQYKLIETKQIAKKQYSSNKDFLMSCDIKVEIHYDCISELDRIHELVLRSNQLNYTKIRSTKAEIEKLLTDNNYTCGTVYVHDRFGDYGMVGFFAIKEKKAIHFLFSCRTIGMGIEQYVFNLLGCPNINIVGDVISTLDSDEPIEWINTESNSKMESVNSLSHKILIKGPCDMEQIYNFLSNTEMVDSEFTHVNPITGVDIQGINHTEHIVQAFQLSEAEKEVVISEVPFSSNDFYSTEMFSGKYDVVFLSTVHDAHFGLYRRKKGGQIVAFGEAKYDLTDSDNWASYISGEYYNSNCRFTQESLRDFSEKYEFIGVIQGEDFRNNIIKILQKLPKRTKLVLILGSEIPCEKDSNPAFKGVHIVHARNNEIVRELSKKYSNLDFIYFGDYIHSQEDYYLNIYHYSAKVYFEVAQKICEVAGNLGASELDVVSSRTVKLARAWQLIRSTFVVSGIIKTIKKIPYAQTIWNKIRDKR